jgi:hypothetical protein
MLRTAAGAGAAGAAGLVASGALAAIPAAAAARPARQPDELTAHSGATTGAGQDRAADGPLVIHVRDARTGEMDVFEGMTHTRLRDPELAARLVRASR